jgi:hypothetical protein
MDGIKQKIYPSDGDCKLSKRAKPSEFSYIAWRSRGIRGRRPLCVILQAELYPS